MPMQTEMKRYTPSVNGFNLSRPPAPVPPPGDEDEDRSRDMLCVQRSNLKGPA